MKWTRLARGVAALALSLTGCVGGGSRPIEVTAIEVTGENDGLFGTLELEVHAFDGATGDWIGCAGGDEGLSGDRVSDVRYDVAAQLIDADRAPLYASALLGHPLRIEVWEDDDNRPCPAPPGPAGPDPTSDDLIGASPAIDLATWRAAPSQGFDRVTELQLDVSR